MAASNIGIRRSVRQILKQAGAIFLKQKNARVRICLSADKWVCVAGELTQLNGGSIPSRSDMKALGLTGLLTAMRNHPAKFKSLKMDQGPPTLPPAPIHSQIIRKKRK